MPQTSLKAIIAAIFCHYDRHSPIRSEVEWDGFRYVGSCQHCRTKVERIAHRDWRRAGRYPAEKAI